MKEAYEKPIIHVEYLTLSQTVASSCGVAPGGGSLGKPTWGDKYSCGWDVGGIILWTVEPSCNNILPEDAEVDIGCYNNPNGGSGIFGS